MKFMGQLFVTVLACYAIILAVRKL
jgi:2-polyprenyl-3-methyl-5-hydroxy-6-metoxy-1,4-benzoquinol methylase